MSNNQYSPNYPASSYHHPAWSYPPPYVNTNPYPIYESLLEKPIPQTTYLPPAHPKLSFVRNWFASSADLRPLPNSNEVRWGIHWYTPTTMALLFILGVASAVSHHVYYSQLDQTTAGNADQQQWVIQIGAGLAFLSGAALASVIGISRTQWVWVTLRRRFITLAGIDALFGVTSDPLYFKNLDMLRRAKLATLMAVIMWIIPFTAILTPGAISVQTITKTYTVSCSVRTLRFDFDTNSTAERLCCTNDNLTTTDVGFYSEEEVSGIPVFTERVLRLAAYSGVIQPPGNNGLDSTGAIPQIKPIHDTTVAQDCGRNCTYTVKFLAPSIKCSEETSWSSPDLAWASPQAFMRKTSYRAGTPVGPSILWVGYIPGGETDPRIILCHRSVARYTVRLDLQDHHFLEPIIQDVETLYVVADSPPQYPDLLYMPNQSVFFILWDVLQGNLTEGSFRASDVTLTPLFSDVYDIRPDLGPEIELMSQKMVVSLLSIDSPGTNKTRPLMRYSALEQNLCATTKSVAVYTYTTHRLLIVYTSTVTIAILMSFVGLVALGRNGVASNMSVSAILRTTRNPTLDHLMGGCLGGNPMPKELEKLRLKFGEVRTGGEKEDGERVGHVALGIEGEVFSIRRGGRYS